MNTTNGLRYLVPLVVCLSFACSGGGGADEGGNDDGGVTGDLTASFTPDTTAPGANTVSTSEDEASGDLVTIEVSITDTDDVYGAGFDLVYPVSIAAFVNWSPGSLLEAGGHNVNYIVDQPVSGRLVVVATRSGSTAGADVSATEPLIRFTFRATEAGSGLVEFENMVVQNEQLQDLPITAWAGGTLAASSS
jgi:hypothetical protein